MKKVLFIALALLTIGSQIEVSAQKKKKEKAKKEMKWEWDGTKSGNTVIDNYLVNIDTLYTKVKAYKEDMASFDMKDDTLYVNGKVYIMTHMVDNTGQLVSRARVNWQCAQAYLEGTNIILDMTNAGLSSANAALELPQLGLNALKFGKYVKGGPVIISEGTTAIKEVRGKYMSNSRKWKAMKDGAIADASSIGYEGFTPEVVKKLNKCYYIKEMRQDDPEYAEVIARFTGKAPEDIAKENQEIAQKIQDTTILPDDKTKQLEQLPEVPEEDA